MGRYDGIRPALVRRSEGTTSVRTALGFPVEMGAEFLDMVGNFGENLQAGRVRLVQAILKRVGTG
jgi:hypothetical protein